MTIEVVFTLDYCARRSVKAVRYTAGLRYRYGAYGLNLAGGSNQPKTHLR